MFNHVHVNIDSVEFEYVTKGNLENISIARPDSVSASDWKEFWTSVKDKERNFGKRGMGLFR